MNAELLKQAKMNYKIDLTKLIGKVCKVNVSDIRDGSLHTFIGLLKDTDTPYFVNFSHPVENCVCNCGEIGLSLNEENQKSVYHLETVKHITEDEFENWIKYASDMDVNILKNHEHLICFVNYKDVKKY